MTKKKPKLDQLLEQLADSEEPQLDEPTPRDRQEAQLLLTSDEARRRHLLAHLNTDAIMQEVMKYYYN